MRLTSLALSSFKSYTGVALNLDAPRVLFAGINGAGKSTIREAVKYALTGRCQGTDARGAGADLLAPHGESKAAVTVGVQGIGTVTRTREKGSSTFEVEGFSGSSQIQQEGLFLKLGIDPAAIDACLDSAAFLDLAHADAKRLILSLLDISIKVEDREFTLDELDAAYDSAFKERAAAKKALQGVYVPPAPTYDGPSMRQIEAQLTKLREALAEQTSTVGQAIGAKRVLEASLERLRANVVIPDDPSEEIAALERQIASLQPSQPLPVGLNDQARIAAERHDPTQGCVIDGQIPCKTPRKQFMLFVELKAKETARLETVVDAEKPNDLTQRIEKLQQKRRAREQAVAAQEQQTRDRDRIQQELDALPETTEAESALAALRGRIQTGEQLLKTAHAAQDALQAHEEGLKRRKGQETEVARLEALCDVLGPKGARVQALGDAAAKFHAAVNPFLAPYGWYVWLQVEPWKVLVATDRPIRGQDYRPLETFSRSERYRIGIALQLAIAQMSGVDCAIVDELDMLDLGNRALATKMLLEAPIGQIVILSTREPSAPLPQGVLAYRLGKNGERTVILESTTVAV